MPRLSRTKIATYFAGEIAEGRPDVPRRLAALLLDSGRTREADLIVADIETLLAARGIIIADVTSARPLDEGFEEVIRQLLAARDGDRVVIREHVDPGLIGGIRINAAGRELDTSVRHRLTKLRAAKA